MIAAEYEDLKESGEVELLYRSRTPRGIKKYFGIRLGIQFEDEWLGMVKSLTEETGMVKVSINEDKYLVFRKDGFYNISKES